MTSKTVVLTQEDFEQFVRYCESTLRILNLQNWSVTYNFYKLEDCYGHCIAEQTGRVATIVLSKEWKNIPISVDKDKQLKLTAVHECLELLVSPLDCIAQSRSFDSDEYEKEKHSVIRVLEKIIAAI